MTVVDFIGFIITMMLMFFIFVRRAWQERRRDPQEKQEQEAHLKKFLKELHGDMEAEEEEPDERKYVPPPKPNSKPIMFKQQGPAPVMHTYPKIDSYHMIVKEKGSRGRVMIEQLPSPKQMIIYQEIMNPPVSMR